MLVSDAELVTTFCLFVVCLLSVLKLDIPSCSRIIKIVKTRQHKFCLYYLIQHVSNLKGQHQSENTKTVISLNSRL